MSEQANVILDSLQLAELVLHDADTSQRIVDNFREPLNLEPVMAWYIKNFAQGEPIYLLDVINFMKKHVSVGYPAEYFKTPVSEEELESLSPSEEIELFKADNPDAEAIELPSGEFAIIK